MTYILGIDPGVEGGWAVIHRDKTGLLKLLDFSLKEQRLPDPSSYFPLMGSPVRVYLERVHAMPAKNDGSSGSNGGQGVVSMFSFGREYGFWLGYLKAFGCEPELVQPQVWQRRNLLAPPARILRKLNETPAESRKRTAANRKILKRAIQEHVCRVFPTHPNLKMVKYEGVCDAIGIALYGAGKK